MSDAPLIFTAEYYQRLCEVEEGHWWSRGMRNIAAVLLRPHLPVAPAVLDAGCGTGVTLDWLSTVCSPQLRVGFDLSPRALEFCRQRGQRRLACASVQGIPIVSDSFDLVTCIDVLQHLPRPDGDRQAVAELGRVLRPGGLLLVRTNAARVGQAESDAADYRRYTPDLLRGVLVGAGLSVERLTLVNSVSPWLEKLRPPATHEGKRGDHGLAIRCLPRHLGWANELLVGALAVEAAYLSRPGRVLRRGHAILGVARKN